MSKKNELITQHYLGNYTRLVKTAVRRVPNNSQALAEEVVQEAYARALKYFRAYDEKSDFNKWFNGIFRNAVNDCRTAEKEHGCTFEYNENLHDLEPISRYQSDLWDTTMKSIAKIENERDRNIMVHYYMSGFSSREISEYTGINHNTVRVIILRHKEKMNDT